MTHLFSLPLPASFWSLQLHANAGFSREPAVSPVLVQILIPLLIGYVIWATYRSSLPMRGCDLVFKIYQDGQGLGRGRQGTENQTLRKMKK